MESQPLEHQGSQTRAVLSLRVCGSRKQNDSNHPQSWTGAQWRPLGEEVSSPFASGRQGWVSLRGGSLLLQRPLGEEVSTPFASRWQGYVSLGVGSLLPPPKAPPSAPVIWMKTPTVPPYALKRGGGGTG